MPTRWIWMLTCATLLSACEAEAPRGSLPETQGLRKEVMPTLPFDRARHLPRVDLRGLEHWRQTLDASSYGFCRVRDGGVECWGGAFGAPRRIAVIDDALEVYTSAERGCAFRESERLTCWFPPGGALEGDGPVELPMLHHALPGAVDWEEQAGIGCAIDRAGVPSCFELCNDQSECYRRFEPLPWPSLEVAVVSPSPLCSCALTREGELTCFGPTCEWWSGQDGAQPHVLQGMSGRMLSRGAFELCVENLDAGGDWRLLCRGGRTHKPGASPDILRRHTIILSLPPGISRPVRSRLLEGAEWDCLMHAEGEVSCRHRGAPYAEVRDRPGAVRDVAGDVNATLCVELSHGDVACRESVAEDQLEGGPWIRVPPAPR